MEETQTKTFTITVKLRPGNGYDRLPSIPVMQLALRRAIYNELNPSQFMDAKVLSVRREMKGARS